MATATKSRKKPIPTIEQCKTEIIDRLTSADGEGLLGSKLSLRQRHYKQAMEELLGAGEVVVLNVTKKTRIYLLSKFAPSLEDVYNKIDSKLSEKTGILFTQREMKSLCLKCCSKPESIYISEAIRYLIGENRMIPVKRRNSTYYLHSAYLKQFISVWERSAIPQKERVFEAYQRLSRQSGWQDIWLSDLYRESGVEIGGLKSLLKEESHMGRVVLSRGDWSLASDEERMAAVYIDGEPFLFVRFKGRVE